MTIGLIEAALDTIYDYLKENLSEKLDVLDAEYKDGIALDDIKDWYRGELPIVMPESPSICIRASAEELDVQREVNVQVKSYLDIICFVGSDDIEKRFKMLARYARAVIELLSEAEGTDDFIFGINGRVTFTEVMASSPFLQGVIVPATAYRLETF